jgi:hypothetical protein
MKRKIISKIIPHNKWIVIITSSPTLWLKTKCHVKKMLVNYWKLLQKATSNQVVSKRKNYRVRAKTSRRFF